MKTELSDKIKAVMRVSDCERCYASKNKGVIIDAINPHTGRTCCYNRDLADVRAEYPDAEEMSISAFCAWKADQQRSPIAWKETTGARFNEMLGCLPPAMMLKGGFLVGEPWDHDAGNGQPRYEAYREIAGKYYKSNRPMTRAEFRSSIAA
jgi:hypothetical protein